MRLIIGGKVIRIEVLDVKGTLVYSTDKNFVVPANINSDEDSIIMIKGRSLPELEYNSIVSIIMTTKSNDRIKLMGAVSVSMDKQLNIKVLRSNSTTVLEERRRYYKLKVNVSGRSLFYVRDEKTIRYDEPHSICVLDINVGGLFMTTEDEYIVDDMVCVEVDMFEDYPLNAAVRVLRVQRDGEGNIIGYGCEFRGLTAAQEDYIGRYIYKVQSEERMKRAAQENGML